MEVLDLRPRTDEEIRETLGRRKSYRVRLLDLPLRERLLRRVDTTDPAHCWIWQGGKGDKDYGTITYRGERLMAHRASFLVFRGALPPDRLVCHNCPGGDNPRCINPLHLYAGTHSDNMLDRYGNRIVAFLPDGSFLRERDAARIVEQLPPVEAAKKIGWHWQVHERPTVDFARLERQRLAGKG